MKRSLTLIIIPLCIGALLLFGILYFVSMFQDDGKDQKSASLTSFKSQKGIYSNKKQAYDAYLRDSAINIRKENVSIDLSALFKSKPNPTAAGDLIPATTSASQPSHTDEPVQPVADANLSATHTKSIRVVPVKASPKIQAQAENATPANHPETKTRESFFSASMETPEDSKEKTPDDRQIIYAVVHSRQNVYQGATVKLRTTADSKISGIAIPVNTFIYGMATLHDERVTITVQAISLPGKMIPVKMEAFDKDGMEGIYIPGFAIHSAASDGVNDAIGEVTRGNLPPGGSTLINTLTRNNNTQSAILTDGYQIILK